METRLLYSKEKGRLLVMSDPGSQLAAIAAYLQSAHDLMAAGQALIGPDSGQRLDNDLTFALPGNALYRYLPRKSLLSAPALVPLPDLWQRP